MKRVPAVCLLFFVSLTGCSNQSDEIATSINADSLNQDVTDEPATDTGAEEASAVVEPGPTEEAAPETPVVEKQSTPPPTIGFAPDTGQATAPPAATSPPEPEEPPEPEPVSWVQRLRFWDMANRIVGTRNEEPAEFDDAGAREFAVALKNVRSLHEHMYSLQQTLWKRRSFAESDYFEELMLASLRDEISLPEGTRGRRKRLSSLWAFDRIQQENELLGLLESRLIADAVTKGDLLQLALRLRENLMHLIALRGHEIALDEFLMSFPSQSAKDFELNEIWGWYPDVRMTTARELWTTDPPDWFREEYANLYKACIEGPGENERDRLFKKSVEPFPDVMENSEFQELVTLADRFEEMSGGADRLLIFPEIGRLPERTRVIEASRRNLAATRKADTEALQTLRNAAFERLSKDTREKVLTIKNEKDRARISWKVPDVEWDRYCEVEDIDRAIKASLESSFSPRTIPSRHWDESSKLMLEQRRKVFDTGARWYFGQAE